MLLFFLGAGFDARADSPAAQGASAPNAAANAASDEPKTLPQDGLFSSIKQNLREGDQEIIRGHFEVGEPPNVHRYYCLMDPKSHRREPNGVLGDPVSRPDGMTGIKSSAVSLYRCDKAEQRGMLVTSGYVVPARSGASAAAAGETPTAPAQAPTAAAAQAPAAPTPPVPTPSAPAGSAWIGTKTGELQCLRCEVFAHARDIVRYADGPPPSRLRAGMQNLFEAQVAACFQRRGSIPSATGFSASP